MRIVCECTLSTDANIKKSAIENLVKIAFLYYDYILPYMEALLKVKLFFNLDNFPSNYIRFRKNILTRNRVLVNHCRS
jgi:hypothetical protein